MTLVKVKQLVQAARTVHVQQSGGFMQVINIVGPEVAAALQSLVWIWQAEAEKDADTSPDLVDQDIIDKLRDKGFINFGE